MPVILHVMHSSGATGFCMVLSVGGVVDVVEAKGEDICGVIGEKRTAALKLTERTHESSARLLRYRPL